MSDRNFTTVEGWANELRLLSQHHAIGQTPKFVVQAMRTISDGLMAAEMAPVARITQQEARILIEGISRFMPQEAKTRARELVVALSDPQAQKAPSNKDAS